MATEAALHTLPALARQPEPRTGVRFSMPPSRRHIASVGQWQERNHRQGGGEVD
jgi:hypothetical protein